MCDYAPCRGPTCLQDRHASSRVSLYRPGHGWRRERPLRKIRADLQTGTEIVRKEDMQTYKTWAKQSLYNKDKGKWFISNIFSLILTRSSSNRCCSLFRSALHSGRTVLLLYNVQYLLFYSYLISKASRKTAFKSTWLLVKNERVGAASGYTVKLGSGPCNTASKNIVVISANYFCWCCIWTNQLFLPSSP